MNNEYQKTYEDFKNITGYDIQYFFQRFVTFVNSQYSYIVDYFNGGEMNKDAFYTLEELMEESRKIEPLFVLHKNTLSTIGDWFLLDTFSEIYTKLLTIRNSAKWLRSALTSTRSNTIKVKKILKTGESFEEVARDLNATDPQNDWLNIVTPQYITEEDYSLEKKSPIFVVNLQNIGINYIDNIVDTLDSNNILGKDINPNFIFSANDLEIVYYEDAIKQALDLILKSMTGSIPEFPEYGIPNDFIGTTVNAFQYPIIFRAILNMFQRDSRWQSVELLDLNRNEDNIFISLRCTTVDENSYIINVPI